MHTTGSHVINHNRVNNSVHAKIDISVYRRAEPAAHHFSIGVYHAPHGYAYRRYSVGERLDQAFYARDYWLTDWAAYDLMSPPDGYVWVRFGPDAILIDEATGDVVQVQYGIFT
jgi:Ni/Co efflux regulator RcnB